MPTVWMNVIKQSHLLIKDDASPLQHIGEKIKFLSDQSCQHSKLHLYHLEE